MIGLREFTQSGSRPESQIGGYTPGSSLRSFVNTGQRTPFPITPTIQPEEDKPFLERAPKPL